MWIKFLINFYTVLFSNIKQWGFWGTHTSFSQQKRILLVCIAGVGDTLMSIPVLRAARQTFPDSHIGFMIHKRKRDAVRQIQYADEMIYYKKGVFKFWSLAFHLRAQRYNHVLVFHSTDPDVLPLCYMTGAEDIIGFEEKSKMNFLLTKILPHDWQIHNIEDRFRLARQIGVQVGATEMEWHVATEEHDEAEQILLDLNPSKPWIGFQLGTGGKDRRWPLEKYIALGKLIYSKLGVFPILLGNERERPMVESVYHALEGRAHKVIVSLRLLGALLQKLDLFVTPNTGPMHMALALKVPFVALFGPTPSHMFGPLVPTPSQVVIRKASSDNGGEVKVEWIEAEEVFQSMEKILLKS